MAQRKLRQRQLQPKSITVDVGNEGDYYPLYSTVYLQLNQLMQGPFSSVISDIEVIEGVVTKITISDLVEFLPDKRYGIVIQSGNTFGQKLISVEVTGEGKTRELTIAAQLLEHNSFLSLGNHLSFGPLDSNGRFSKITNVMKITEIAPNNDGYTLTLKDYNPEIYSYGGAIPPYKSNLTKKQVPNNSVSINDLNKMRQDMNVLQEDLIRAYQLLQMPVVVDADVKQVTVEVDEKGFSAAVFRVTTKVTCKQGDENRDFSIGSIAVPEGWSYTVDGGRITFIIGEGVRVTSGQFKIPVIYRPIVSSNPYVDENGEPYVDENNQPYVEIEMASSPYVYDIWFSYFGLGNGAYLGLIRELEDIPATANLNDYFVWGGENNIVYEMSVEGVLKQARTYKFIGLNKAWKWEVDQNAEHQQIALSDVLSLANADLQNNNSTAWEYLDHLTTNTAYIDMIIANNAFIDKLSARIITADIVTTDELFVNNKIKADLIDVASIKSSEGFLTMLL